MKTRKCGSEAMASSVVVCNCAGGLRVRDGATTRELLDDAWRAQRIRHQECDFADGDAWAHRARQRVREGRKDCGVRRQRFGPATAAVIDAEGKYVTPGIIDPHSHMALGDDVNEATNPVVPQMMMKDAFDYNDKAIYRALAGGVTSSLLLHGSADMIGGQAVVIKNKYGLDRDQMLFPGAPQSIKFASGENPKRVFGDKKQLPSTRMGNFEVMREAFTQAKDYQRSWDEYNEKVKKGDKTASAPKKDLKLEALVEVLQGKLLVQIHCYRSDEMLTEIAIAKEFGYKIRAFHHALEAYKVPDFLAKDNIGIATFADWWGYKYEAWDAIPWNAVIAMRHGVKVAHQERQQRLHAAAEPGGGEDHALRWRHRRRSDADADD